MGASDWKTQLSWSFWPSFLSVQGVKRCSPITGCEEFYYPPWKRALFRWLVSLPVCLLCLCFVFLAMLLCLELQVWIRQLRQKPSWRRCKHSCSRCLLQEVVMEIQELPGITRFVPKILLALTVTICDEVYKKIAYWLNDMGERVFSWSGVMVCTLTY